MGETNFQLDENGIPTDADDPDASMTMIVAIIGVALIAAAVFGVTGLTYQGARQEFDKGSKAQVIVLQEQRQAQMDNLKRSGVEVVDGEEVSRMPIAQAKEAVIQRYGKKQ